MKKIPYLSIWLMTLFIFAISSLRSTNHSQWVDPSTIPTSTSLEDETQEPVMQQDTTNEGKISPSYVERLKAAVKRFRTCLAEEGACSEQERREAIDLANNLLDLVLLTAGVSFVEAGELIENKVKEWQEDS